MTAQTILALDVGAKRIGVSVASTSARLPHPHRALERSKSTLHDIVRLVSEQRAIAVVLGLPRGLEGQETAQTREVRAFAGELEAHLNVPIHWQDEAVTSKQAEQELNRRGKPFQKGDVDSLAATYILEDFLREHHESLERIA